jgi:hypothetical protein
MGVSKTTLVGLVEVLPLSLSPSPSLPLSLSSLEGFEEHTNILCRFSHPEAKDPTSCGWCILLRISTRWLSGYIFEEVSPPCSRGGSKGQITMGRPNLGGALLTSSARAGRQAQREFMLHAKVMMVSSGRHVW